MFNIFTVHPCIIFIKWSQLDPHYFLVYIYFNFSTCFGQMCAHHQESLLYLCDTGIFHSVWDETHPNQQTRQSPRQSEKYQCHIDTVSSPDDGHTVARNMYRSWNKYTNKKCVPIWFHLKKKTTASNQCNFKMAKMFRPQRIIFRPAVHNI